MAFLPVIENRTSINELSIHGAGVNNAFGISSSSLHLSVNQTITIPHSLARLIITAKFQDLITAKCQGFQLTITKFIINQFSLKVHFYQ